MKPSLVAAIALGTAVSLAACAADAVMGTSLSRNVRHSWEEPTLVQCPVNQTSTTSALVGPLGGIVDLGGTKVEIPAGALLSPVTVTVTEPASQYMEITVSVEGSEHFVFELPVTVTLSYARCSRSNINLVPLTAWYIDSETHELLEPMIGVDNKLTRTITFATPHFSGYAVAN